MGWWGKIIGGAFGFMLGGPIGALIGAALGHNLDRGLDRLEAEGAPGAGPVNERAQAAFFAATFSVMGHVAKADGRVSDAEIRLANEVMAGLGLTDEMRAAARALFRQGKSPDFDLDAVLEQLRAECRRSAHLLRMFLEIQIQAALADGRLEAGERRVLERICARLGFSPLDFERIEAFVRAGGGRRAGVDHRPSLEDAYALLEVTPECSDAELKRAYRRMMSRHHPDKLVAKGLPEEMVRLANERTAEIRAAYERIREARERDGRA